MMLSKILKSEMCEACGGCCSFKKESLGLFPVFDDGRVTADDLADGFKSDDPEEELACPCLDDSNDCTLSEQEEPFECRIRPLHVMQKGDERVITLSPNCPAFHGEVTDALRAFLIDDRMGNYIFCHADMHPEIVRDYVEGYEVIMTG